MKKFKQPTYKTSSKQFEKSYNRYVNMYNAKNTAMGKRGLKIRERKYSRAEFEAEYTALRNESAYKDVVKGLVKEQAYQWSKAQATAFREGIIAAGVDPKKAPSVEELRINGKEYLDKYIDRLREKHPDWSSSELGIEVGQTVFGSD